MSDFVNTVLTVGDDALTDSILDRTVTEFHDSAVTTIGVYAFRGATALKSVKIPNVITMADNSFGNCPSLEIVDTSALEDIEGVIFPGCSSLRALILRNVSTMAQIYASSLSGSAVASGIGYIYVPSALVESYKTAANWSTYANQFRALEDYTVDGTVTGELDESKI